jgi:hypothetical protein
VEEVYDSIKGDSLQIRREGDDANEILLVGKVSSDREWLRNITYKK